MAYENISLAKLAKEKWDYLVQRLQNGCDFELRPWKFEGLRTPKLRNTEVHDAAKAQMVFVVTCGAGDLPPDVQAWIEQWLALQDRKQDAARLLAFLFDRSPETIGASAFSQFAYQQQAARRGSMDFIVSATPNQSQHNTVKLHITTGRMRSWEVNVSPGRDHAPNPKRDMVL